MTSIPKPIVNSWDVFDTLLARFVEPREIFEIVEARHGAGRFIDRRMSAQATLDRIGRPYTVYEIYDVMVQQGSLARGLARKLLREEILVEQENLIPIRRNIARVRPTDLIVSDMYLPPEFISSLLFEVCEMPAHRPVVVSNWGKHTGTIWNELQKAYIIRRHFGDNPKSDAEVPSKFGIECELVSDAAPTAWETTLRGAGMDQFARILREVRLRCMPVNTTVIHEMICGPYVTLLASYAVHLMQKFGEDARFGFLSRDGDDLSRIFRAFYPAIAAFEIDLSRRMIRDPALEPFFSSRINQSTILVDILSTSRSYFEFAERTGSHCKTFATLQLLEGMMAPKEKSVSEERRQTGKLHYFVASQMASHYPLECLLQTHIRPFPRWSTIRIRAG